MKEILVSRSLLLEFGGWLVFSTLFFLFNYYLVKQTEMTAVLLQIESEAPGTLRIYWRSRSQGYAEERSVAMMIKPEIHSYSVDIPAPSRFSYLRIDPLDKPGRMVIGKMILRHSLYHPDEMDAQELINDTGQTSGIKILTLKDDREASLQLTDHDSWFVIHPVLPLDFKVLGLWCMAGLVMGTCLFVWLNKSLNRGRQSKGLLWLEDSRDNSVESRIWFALIHMHLTSVVLIKAVETASLRTYWFSFVSSNPQNIHLLVVALHRHCPRLHIRTQLNCSGEAIGT